jgi:lipoprotein-anchoring transpeptidase ErfK/SrfK
MNGDNFGRGPANRGIRVTRGKIAAAAASAAILGTGVGLALTRGGPPTAASAPAGRPAASVSAHGTASAVPAATTGPLIPASTELATMLHSAIRYASPGLVFGGTVPARWYGRHSVLPVIATKPGWVQVRLAQRPNQSTAWVPATDVRLSSTPYRIVINLTTMRLALYQHGRRVLTAPAGIGTTDDPTPTGHFFVAFDEPPPQPDPGYGPFIMVTSAHSPNISDWESSGDAIIGIHGPLGDDSEIGATGARLSHGCIRLHAQALLRLSQVPPGTPIDIVQGGS